MHWTLEIVINNLLLHFSQARNIMKNSVWESYSSGAQLVRATRVAIESHTQHQTGTNDNFSIVLDSFLEGTVDQLSA